MTAPRLEIAYRRLLRCYPPRWRHENGDEVVATLLDVADADGRTRPSPGDVANLLLHGFAARFGASLGLVPAVVRHRIAILALASVATLSLCLFVVAEVVPEPYPTTGYPQSSTGLTFGPFVTLGAALYPLPVLAFVAAAAGAGRVARAVLWLTCLAVCAVVLAAAHSDAERPQLYLLMVLFLLAGMAAAGLPPTVHRRGLFAATMVIGLFLAGAMARSVAYFHQVYSGASWNWPFLAYRGPGGFLDTVEMIVPAAGGLGAVVAIAVSMRQPGWIVATFTVGGTWSLMPIADSIRYDRWGWENDYAGTGFVFGGALLALAAVIDLLRAAEQATAQNPDLPAGRRSATDPN